MIHTRPKRYQLSFWEISRDDRVKPGLRMEFDDLEEARAAFDRHRSVGFYRAGLFLDWRTDLSEWLLVDMYSEENHG
jgi:hypothetical protein